ncbi:bifunctional demethylmenaquinone methyltransferase/2-methoxy-6-polyprenyl-1,4-benzoquinol methylase UbiE [Chlamydia gallinacea]|uniref:bifunctional demethylmenaquinone methyltransferase/2-methoxy-6-polyprenyl-1,4-benzoquinol methylase UbiE n=1 Tax=Chlamydia gallinacea TaxID=1457153 RepID=UPI0024E22B0F|nr:bifunctional demethylmenaquinone methyltransferase/2-methoxy-6-polyprenyl-1,4-benzoquinol methylase UbiE [Chlamydia gallinacea]
MVKSLNTKPDIREMFNILAPKYDKINTILSLGMHHYWNRIFSKMLGQSEWILDLCSGTGKVAYQYTCDYPQSQAILVDFSPNMLCEAKKRYPQAPFTFIESDITQLPLNSESHALASLAYGLRNLPDPQRALNEIHRILTNNGSLGILELTSPSRKHPVYWGHRLYLNYIVPKLGKYYSKSTDAYTYLSQSIAQLPKDQHLEQLFRNSQFTITQKRKLMYGTATIWILRKNKH